MSCYAVWHVSLHQDGRTVRMHRTSNFPGPPVKGQTVKFASGEVQVGQVTIEETGEYFTYSVANAVFLPGGEDEMEKAVGEWRGKGFAITSNTYAAYNGLCSVLYHLRSAQSLISKTLPALPGLETENPVIYSLKAVEINVDAMLRVLGELDAAKFKLDELMASGKGTAEEMATLGKKVNELMVKIFN